MRKHDETFSDYALRRHQLSGVIGAGEYFPYSTPIDQLGIDRIGDTGGLRAHGKLVSFAHYDYLGLEGDASIVAVACAATRDFGVSAGASRFVGGELSVHRSLERDFADFIGVDDTIALVSGYGTNVTLIGHVLGKKDLLLVDEAIHNSVVTGARLSRSECLAFRHNDMDHLRALLTLGRSTHNRALVVVEGLYSMDGDVPDLPALIALCRDFDAWLMIDEAHSIGVLGGSGRGITEHFGVPIDEIDLVVGTLSKAFVGCGGFIGARAPVIDWLRHTLPGFVYSVGMTPATAAAARQALAVLRQEPQRLDRLIANSSMFLHCAESHGLDTGTAVGAAVIPVMAHDLPTALEAAQAALAAGYFVPPIAQIAVPKGKPRLRFFVTASHSQQDIDGVLRAVAPVLRRCVKTSQSKDLTASL